MSIAAILVGTDKFREANNRYPNSLVVFRDGVNAGQLEMVHMEAIHLHQAVKAKADVADMTVTFAIVQKRHNAKIFSVRLTLFTHLTAHVRQVLDKLEIIVK